MSGLTSIFDLCVNLGWPPCPAQIARPVRTYGDSGNFLHLVLPIALILITLGTYINPIAIRRQISPTLFVNVPTGLETKNLTIWIVYFRLKEKMNSAKAAGNSSMDFCLFLTQYATDDGRRQLCTVLALMKFFTLLFLLHEFLAAMGWISPGGRSNIFWNLAPKQNSPYWSKNSCLLSFEAWCKLLALWCF